MCSLRIEPTTFYAADAMLYHWATQEHRNLMIAPKSARLALSTFPTDLYCLFSSLSFSLRYWIILALFLALWLGAYAVGAGLDASIPNRSAAMFTMRVVIVLSRWFTSPLAVTSRTWLTSSSNCCHSPLLEDLGHWILGWLKGHSQLLWLQLAGWSPVDCREMLFLWLWSYVSCWQKLLATLGGSGHCGLPPGMAPLQWWSVTKYNYFVTVLKYIFQVSVLYWSSFILSNFYFYFITFQSIRSYFLLHYIS